MMSVSGDEMQADAPSSRWRHRFMPSSPEIFPESMPVEVFTDEHAAEVNEMFFNGCVRTCAKSQTFPVSSIDHWRFWIDALRIAYNYKLSCHVIPFFTYFNFLVRFFVSIEILFTPDIIEKGLPTFNKCLYINIILWSFEFRLKEDSLTRKSGE